MMRIESCLFVQINWSQQHLNLDLHATRCPAKTSVNMSAKMVILDDVTMV